MELWKSDSELSKLGRPVPERGKSLDVSLRRKGRSVSPIRNVKSTNYQLGLPTHFVHVIGEQREKPTGVPSPRGGSPGSLVQSW